MHCSVRLADMYRLQLPEGSFDFAVMQMVLHYAEDPPGALAEVSRVLRLGGRLIVIDLAEHGRDDLLTRLAHRWPGFSDDAMRGLLEGAGMQQGVPRTIDGPLAIRLWPATRAADAPIAQLRAVAV
jgi:ArsR family transcriptional regulator